MTVLNREHSVICRYMYDGFKMPPKPLRELSPLHKEMVGNRYLLRRGQQRKLVDEEVVKVLYVYKNGKCKVVSMDTDETIICKTKDLFLP